MTGGLHFFGSTPLPEQFRYWFLLSIFFLLPRTFLVADDQAKPSFAEGWRWSSFTRDAGLPSDHITFITETTTGMPWVGTPKGIAWYDDFRWNVVDSSRGLPSGAPTALESDANGNVLVIIKGNIYRGNRDGFVKLPITNVQAVVALERNDLLLRLRDSLFIYSGGVLHRVLPPALNNDAAIDGIFRPRSGNVWVGMGGQLFRWSQNNQSLIPMHTGRNLTMPLLAENSAGTGIVVSGQRGNGFEWTDAGTHIRPLKEIARRITSMDIGPDGDVLVVNASGEVRTREGGIWRTLPSIGAVQNITALRFRSTGDLWVGSESGLFLFRGSIRRWKFRQHAGPDPRNDVNAILQRRDGTIWLGTGGGIEIVGRDDSSTTIDRIEKTPIGAITGLKEDREGRVWISSGSSFRGSYCWNDTVWTHHPVSSVPEGIFVHRIESDRSGRLWFLGLSQRPRPDPSVFILDHGRIEHWEPDRGLLSGKVYDFMEGPDGSLWFATWGGLNRWREGQWKSWPANENGGPGRVFSLCVDHNGRVWFANQLATVAYIDETDSARWPSENNELSRHQVWSIREDPHEKLWMTTQKGLLCFSNGSLIRFDNLNGMRYPFCWPVHFGENEIYVGTIGGGLGTMDQSEAKLPRPKAFISKPIIEKERVRLSWEVHSFWGAQPINEILIRHRLDQEEWSAWSTLRQLEFTEISAGEHSFDVQTMDFFGNTGSDLASIVFSIPRPFYQQPLVLIPILALSASVLGLGFVHLRRRARHAAALRESESKFRRLTEATFEGIVIHDHGRVVDINRSLTSMLGFELSELAGKSVTEIATSDSRAKLQEFTAEEFTEPRELRLNKSDGTEIIAELISKRISSNGKMLGVLTIRDITERKKAEAALRMYEDQLRSLAQQLSKLEENSRRQMASYLHDYIGHTLAICKMKLGSLLQTRNEPDLVGVRSLIEEAITKTRSLTFDLSPPVIHDLSLPDALEWLTASFQETHNMLVFFESDDDIGEVPEDLRSFLYHGVRELLLNIIKHAKAKSAEVSVKRVNEEIVVSVKDDGVGFLEVDVNPRISRVTGYGLFSLRERISYYGGRMDVHSEVGSGTLITLHVPIRNQSH